MKGVYNIMSEIHKSILFTEEEFNYIKEVIHNLSTVENKIPKAMKSTKSIILKQLNDRFSRMVF